MKNNNHLKANLLICGDNLNALDDLIKQGIKVDLIYLDPPFFSNRHYEVVWGDEAEVRSFKDRWAGGINVYVEWMRERVVKMYDILKDTGSFYLHCDWHASHYLKVMLDDLFGHGKFRNEIIWKRKTGSSSYVHKSKKFGTCTDSLFFYVKSNKAEFQPQYSFDAPGYKEYIDKFFRHFDENGRRFRIDNLANPAPRPNLMYEYKGYKPPKNGWAISKEKMEQWDKEGRLYFPKKKDGRIQRKRFFDELKGRPVQSLWDDIEMISSQSAERLGYPTQKPEQLLERIVRASSNKNDIVLDPFCGCGTAMAVAQRLGRRWVGIDISPTAVSLIQERLQKIGATSGKDFDVIGTPTTVTNLQELEPFEFQNWIINEMKARHSKRKTADMGIDGYYEKTIFTDRAGIQVKQSERVGRNVVDNFETALRRQQYEKGYIIAFSFTKGANEEVARVKQKDLIIKLVKVEDLLYGKFKV